MASRLLTIVLLSFVLAASGASVFLTENAGIARAGEPMTFGIPLKMGELPGVSMGGNAGLSLSGLPAQYQVLSRWYDGSARFVLASLVTDFSAGETRALSLGHGAGSASSSNLSVTQSSDTVTLRTGVITVEVLKGQKFNLINRIWRGSTLVVDNTGMRGLVVASHIDNGDSDEYVGRALTDSVIVEENGPVRAVVYVAGRFYSGTKLLEAALSGGRTCSDARPAQILPPYIRFMVRLTVFNNKDEIWISTVLHNTGGNGLQGVGPGAGGPVTLTFDASNVKTFSVCDWDVQPLYFSSFYYDLKLNLAASRTAVTEGGVSASLTQAGRASFLQAGPDKYYLFQNGTQTGTGGRGDGYMDVSDGTAGVGAALKYCWEAYPKRLDVIGDTFRVNLFPRDIAPADTYFTTGDEYYTGNKDKWTKCYMAPGGVWLRDDVFLSVHGSGFDIRNFSKARKNPVMPKFEDAYLHATKAVPGFYSDTMRFVEPAGCLQQRLYERKRIWAGIQYDYDMTETDSWCGRARESLWEWWDLFGRLDRGPLNMGDIRWGDGFCNLHYDQTAGVLHSFLRTGTYKAWKVADLMAWHRSNITTYHHANGHCYNDGLSRYEKDDHDNGYVSPRPSHHWCEGMGLYYVLTGDPFVRESFREGVDGVFWGYVWRFGGAAGSLTQTYVQPELRHMGWPILNFMSGYAFLQDERYYKMLSLMFHNGLIPTENSIGPGFTGPTDSLDLMQGYLETPLIHMYDAIKPSDTGLKDSLKAMIGRMWQTVDRNVVSWGSIDSSMFRFPIVLCHAYLNSMDAVTLADLGGFAWKELGIPEARTLAFMQMLRVVGYHIYVDSHAVNDYKDAVYQSCQFTYSETKLHGKIGLHGRKLLEYEYDSLCPVLPGDGALEGTAVESGPPAARADLRIQSCRPNPFNPSVAVVLSVPAPHAREPLAFSVYDVSGRLIRRFALAAGRPGLQRIVWDGRDGFRNEAASGVYFVQVSGKACRTAVKKIMKIK